MTASSQTHPGAQPPHDPRPLQTAVASYAAAIPVPGGPVAPVGPDVPYYLRARAPESQLPECFTCGTDMGTLYPDPRGRRYPSGAQVMFCGACVPDATPAQAVTAVVAAEMAKDAPVTARDIADAELQAGMVFDAKRVEAVRTAAYEQAKAEDRAELAAAAQDREAKDWFHTRWLAAGRLCEDLALDDVLPVRDVLTALDGRAPATLPLTIRWDGSVADPAGDGPGETTLVGGATARGGRAVLVLDAAQRRALASLLQLEVRDIHAQCPTEGCGTVDDYDASDPSMFGWSRLQVASVGDGPRWYCSDMCVFDALARAGHELAADDQADDLDARYGPGASDEYVLQQGEAMQAAFEDERGDDGDGAW